jgi:hypothetical protein
MHGFHCPATQVVDPPTVVYRDFYHPQLVQIIHPIEIINRHHCVPVPHHTYTYSVKDEFCPGPVTGPVASVRSIKK